MYMFVYDNVIDVRISQKKHLDNKYFMQSLTVNSYFPHVQQTCIHNTLQPSASRSNSSGSSKKRPRPSVVPNPPKLTRMMIKLWELIVDYKDSNSRQISNIFMVLPTRKELPQYYQIIKKPMDLKKIKVCVVCMCVEKESLVQMMDIF